MAEEILRSLVVVALLITVFYVCGMIGVEYSRWRRRRKVLRSDTPQPYPLRAPARSALKATIKFDDPALVRGYDSPEICRLDASIRSEQLRLHTKPE